MYIYIINVYTHRIIKVRIIVNPSETMQIRRQYSGIFKL